MGTDETSLVEQGLSRLGSLLGPAWEVTRIGPGAGRRAHDDGLLVSIRDTGQGIDSGPVVVETTEKDLPPRTINSDLVPQVELARHLHFAAAVLVLAPWLSPRSRTLLDSLGYGYLDLTGNVSFQLERPRVVIRTEGAARAPQPAKAYVRHLRGEKAGALVRALVDVTPPYRAGELAKATGLSLAYVSRLLDTMQSQALIDRRGKEIVSVDWQELLRAYSSHYVLLRAHPPVPMIAPRGRDAVFNALRDLPAGPGRPRVAITGPVAAAAVAPLTAGGQLMIYVESGAEEDLTPAARQLQLLPSTTVGTDVLLFRTGGSAVLTGRRWVDGVPHVALSQLVLDGLGGTGRMPAEGEAVLEFMARDETRWRLDSLDGWGDERRR